MHPHQPLSSCLLFSSVQNIYAFMKIPVGVFGNFMFDLLTYQRKNSHKTSQHPETDSKKQ
jgi:hypothetical protein